MSTDSVFDGQSGDYQESDAPRPLNHYAASKLAAEAVVQALLPDHLIVRANIFGWNAQPKSSLAEWVLGRLEAGEQVPGFTDAVFAPLLVNTLADIMLAMLMRPASGLYHVASRNAVSKYEFALTLATVFGLPDGLVKPTLVGTSLKTLRPRNTTLDTRKFRRDIGIALPAVSEDVQRFRLLRDTGFVDRLKAACSNTP
jgi:dTDP-4-dehydrorhamnose reductase